MVKTTLKAYVPMSECSGRVVTRQAVLRLDDLLIIAVLRDIK